MKGVCIVMDWTIFLLFCVVVSLVILGTIYMLYKNNEAKKRGLLRAKLELEQVQNRKKHNLGMLEKEESEAVIERKPLS